MEAKIKSATLDDLKNIQKLNLLLLEELNKNCDQTNDCTWSLSEKGEDYFKEMIVNDSCCAFISLINNEIIGYLVGSIQEEQPYRDIPNSAEIGSFFVAKKYRGVNIGSQLNQKFIKWCRLKNIKRISVITPVKNLRAIEFYRKNGFFDYDLILESLIK